MGQTLDGVVQSALGGSRVVVMHGNRLGNGVRGTLIGSGLQINAPTEGQVVSVQPVFDGYWGILGRSGVVPAVLELARSV